jgi:uncharacterized protein (TIGR03118 family)
MCISRPLCLVAKLSSVVALSLSPSLLTAGTFDQTNLVANAAGIATTTDPNLINPWGIAFSATSPFWIANQGAGNATLYDGAGNIVPLVVTVPGGTSLTAGPTGQVFNGGTGFNLPNNNPAKFIFGSLQGTISGWNGGASAVTMSTVPGAIYTGLALASSGGNSYLYAADQNGAVRVFNSSYQQVNLAGNFTDPNAIANYVPYNIQPIGSSLYVTYQHIDSMGNTLAGGYVDVFNTDGTFVKRFATGGALDAPWGVALAPAGFGQFGNDLLIGNNDNDGEINAFDPSTGVWLGTLDGSNGQPLMNNQLWAIDFRTGGANVDPNALYIDAGINNEAGGLFAEITPTTPEPASLALGSLGMIALFLLRRKN